MASNGYCLGDLSFTSQRIRSTAGSESLVFRVWGGSLRIGVVKEKEFKPIFEKSLAPNKVTMLKSIITKIKHASPGAKFPLVCSTYAKETKSWSIEYVITFLKDDKNVYHIEIQWKGAKYDCVLKGPGGVAYGSDPLSDADKSAIELETLYDWLTTIAPIQCVLSNKKREFDPSVNGASYVANTGASKGGGAPVSSSDEDFF